MDQTLAEHDIKKVVAMRLSGEDQIYKQEYETCLERVQARQRILERVQARQARRLYLSTNRKA